jgi:RHS repeat-associated protein
VTKRLVLNVLLCCITIQFGYDADNNRTTKTITSGGVSHSVNDVYVLGHLADETDQSGTVLATFTYDSMGVPVSVQVGSDPNSSPRYYYVYNGHGDVVALVDASGNTVASYSYDAFGQLTSASENFGSGTTWTNPYRYDGKDGVRYDGETGLYWMSVRAYDPALGRFLRRDPLGRAPLFFSDQPYVYAGNNPLVYVDPSGEKNADPYDVKHIKLPPLPKGGKRIRPDKAAWERSDERKKFILRLSYPHDDHDGHGWHLNLRVQYLGAPSDLHNFHIYFRGQGPFFWAVYTWSFKDHVPGKDDVPGVTKSTDDEDEGEKITSWSPILLLASEEIAGAIQTVVLDTLGNDSEAVNYFYSDGSGMRDKLAEGLRELTTHQVLQKP